MDNDFATGYALGADSASGDRNNGGFWGGDGWWAIIIFAMIFGWGNGGWGGFGGGNGGGYAATAATQADIQRGFDNSAVRWILRRKQRPADGHQQPEHRHDAGL